MLPYGRRSPEWSAVLLLAAMLLGPEGVAMVAMAPEAGAAPRSAVGDPAVPFSASGCNQNVCIHIQGSGTYVADWWTTATLPRATCTEALFWANGELVHAGATHCGSAGSSYSSDWPGPQYFPAGTEVCQTWVNVPGRPCERIE